MTTTDGELEDVATWANSGTIEANIQPLKGGMSRGEMGVTANSTHKLFSLGAVESNTRIVCGADTYLVGYVSEWGGHYEAILEKVIV